jgi:AraC family transcriptional activator of mar-sox-rob regulon
MRSPLNVPIQHTQISFMSRFSRRIVKPYIEVHLNAIQSVEEIAAALSVAVRTLRRQFRRDEGVPLGRYLTRRRIARMKRLLRGTDRTHRQIARATGYQHAASAARAFKRATGQTMTTYRAEHQTS